MKTDSIECVTLVYSWQDSEGHNHLQKEEGRLDSVGRVYCRSRCGFWVQAVGNLKPERIIRGDDVLPKVKLLSGVLFGTIMPRHIGLAYGRYIFALLHTNRKPKVQIWLRDLPQNICDLDYDYGFDEPLRAYVAECDRAGIPRSERVADIEPMTA